MAPDTESIAGYAIYNNEAAPEYRNPNPTRSGMPHPLGNHQYLLA
jgi:hypothetical protein